jgi:hypothetical protein
MSSTEQLSPFDAALAAFVLRFEGELDSRWQHLESEAAVAIVDPSENKRAVLYRFFDDAGEAIAEVVHEYFPRLLQVAATQRRHLGSASPLAWTKAQVLREVCTFLGFDEKFDHTSAPRDEGRLSVATIRIVLRGSWLDEAVPTDFVLPGWADSRRAVMLAFGPPETAKEESLPPLSRAETLEWIKQREFWIRGRLERQIENDGWDGVIEAGRLDISVLEAFGAVNALQTEKQLTIGDSDRHENCFVKEVATWAIAFGAETCRLKLMNGLDYIAFLLQNPGRPVRARELLTLAGGLSTGFIAELRAGSLRDGGSGRKCDDQDDVLSDHSDFVRHEVVDDKTRREVEQRLSEIEREIVYNQAIGDLEKVDRLREECATLQSYLGGSRNVHRRPRVFSSENEKARTTVTKAIQRAYERIREQAPKTAIYLKSTISTGSEFMYRDASTAWIVRRTP